MKINFALHTYRPPPAGAPIECALFYAMALDIPAYMHFKVLAAFVTQARNEGHRIDEAALVAKVRGRPKLYGAQCALAVFIPDQLPAWTLSIEIEGLLLAA